MGCEMNGMAETRVRRLCSSYPSFNRHFALNARVWRLPFVIFDYRSWTRIWGWFSSRPYRGGSTWGFVYVRTHSEGMILEIVRYF